MDHPSLIGQYRDVLRDALRTDADEAIHLAAALGAVAAAEGMPLSAVLPVHRAVVAEALGDAHAVVMTERAMAFLTAFLEPLERGHVILVEQKHAIEQLPEVLLEGIPAVVYVSSWHGQTGEMLYVSPQTEAVLGYSAPEWIAEPMLWLNRLDPEDRDRVIAERAVARSEGGAFVSEYRLHARDDRVVWLHDEARVVPDAAGHPQFWQGVLLDITQRKAAELEAAEAERMRLARELHDSVTQTLLAVTMHARTLPKVWRSSPADAAARLSELEALAATALAEMRTMLLELRPAELTRVTLPLLFSQLVTAMRSRCQAAIQLSVDPLPLQPPDVQIAFYRVGQEALNNVARHARARSALVTLREEAGVIELIVTDDGQGFDRAAVPGGHLGLRGMRERAEAIGAQLTLDSSADRGTRVALTWRRTP